MTRYFEIIENRMQKDWTPANVLTHLLDIYLNLHKKKSIFSSSMEDTLFAEKLCKLMI
jgi:hypothetical protein